MVSSQHLVRQALLHSRPKVWPVELPKLSQSAIDKYLDEEAVFLKSTAGKKYDPERAHDHIRSSFQAYLEGTVHMESNVDYQELLAGARANLEESNTASNTYGAPDKDTFCLDPIYRELSSMPFGPNETRLPDETVLFVIAALASVLQVHWWSYCASCFKQSRNKTAAQMCRYLFPRARVEVGRIGTSAILLVRKLGEEYINGYSDVILRAFKCNHDIHAQVAMVLFKPFRVLSDLRPHGSTWHEAWESFQPTMSTGSAEVYHFMQDYHVGRKKAAKTRTSREEEQNIQMENDDGRTEPDDFDDIDFENALLFASRHPATSHLDCDVARETTSELYQAVSSSEMSNQVKFPTTTPIDADIAALVGGQFLDEASTTASSSYMSILGAWDQRLRYREQFASDVKGQ
ncbi:hypothetical protein H257_19382, partial [Aphanomyces astaci]